MTTAPAEELEAWAASGAMWLTGRAGGPPLAAPPGFVARLLAVGDALASRSAAAGCRVGVDVLALLGERAAIAGLRRAGDVSCGASARLLPAADGWLAINLARPEDLDLLPAWLAGSTVDPARWSVSRGSAARHADPAESAERHERFTSLDGGQSAPAFADTGEFRVPSDIWRDLAAAVALLPAEPLVERAGWLGLPMAALPTDPLAVPPASGPLAGLPVAATEITGPAPNKEQSRTVPPSATAGPSAPAGLDGKLVVDLSSLWAGPLCSHLLQLAGARVVKVESVHRPDGARFGPAAFFDLLHAGQEAVALDFRSPEGRADLRRLIGAADVVVEASRPRALEQLGIDASAGLQAAAATGRGPQVWVSITGYGRAAPGRNRVAFGDDAAVAGGLVARDEAGPCFLADAVADPCSGLVAATATLAALAAGGHWLLDISMRDVAAHLAGPDHGWTAPPPPGLVAAPPWARTASGRAPQLGQHTSLVLAELHSR